MATVAHAKIQWTRLAQQSHLPDAREDVVRHSLPAFAAQLIFQLAQSLLHVAADKE